MNEDRYSGSRRGPYRKVNDVPPRRKYEVHTLSSHQSSSTIRKEVQEPKKNPPEAVVVKRDFITTDLSRRNALGTSSTSSDSMFKIPKISDSITRTNNLNNGQKSEKRCTTFYSASFEMELNRKRAAEREANLQARKRPPQYSRYKFNEDSMPDRMQEDISSVYDSRRMDIKSTVGAVYDSKKSEFFSESQHKKPASEPKRKTEYHIRSSSEWKHYPNNSYANEQKITEVKAAASRAKKAEVKISAYERKKMEAAKSAASKQKKTESKVSAYEKKKMETKAAAYEQKISAAKAAAYEKKKLEEQARAAAYEKKKLEEQARAAAYEKKKMEEQARAAAYEKKKMEEQARAAAFEKRKMEEQARAAAFEKKKMEEKARVAAYEKKKMEEQARVAAFEKKKMEEQAKAAAYEKKKMEEQAAASRQKKAESKAANSRQKKTEPKASAGRQKKTESKTSVYEQKVTVSKASAYEQKIAEAKTLANEQKKMEVKAAAKEQKKAESKASVYEQRKTESKTSYSERKKTEPKAPAYEQKKTEAKSSTSEHKKHESKASVGEQKKTEAKTSANEQKKAGARASTSSNVDVKHQEQKEIPSKVMVVKPEFRTTDLSRRDVPGTSTNKSDSMYEMPKIQPISTNTNVKITKLSLKEYNEKKANKSSPANLEIKLHKDTTAEGMIKVSVRRIGADAEAVAHEQKISVIKVAPNEQKTSESKASASEHKITVVKAAPSAQDKTEAKATPSEQKKLESKASAASEQKKTESKASASKQKITEAEAPPNEQKKTEAKAPPSEQKVESEAKTLVNGQKKTVAKATASGQKKKVSKASARGQKKKGAKTLAKAKTSTKAKTLAKAKTSTEAQTLVDANKKTEAKTSASGQKEKVAKTVVNGHKKTGAKTSASESKKKGAKTVVNGHKKTGGKTSVSGKKKKGAKTSAKGVKKTAAKTSASGKKKTVSKVSTSGQKKAKASDSEQKKAKASDSEQKKAEVKTSSGDEVAKPVKSSAENVVEPENKEIKPVKQRKKPGPKPKRKTEAQIAAIERRREKLAAAAAARALEKKNRPSKRVLLKRAFKPKRGPIAEVVEEHSVLKPSGSVLKKSTIKSKNSIKSTLKKAIKSSSNKSANSSSNKSAKTSLNKSANSSLNKSANSSSNKSAKTSLNKSANSSLNKSANSSSNKSAKTSLNKSANSSLNKSADSSSNKSAKTSLNKSAKTSLNKSANSSSNKSAKTSLNKPANSSSNNSANSSSNKSTNSVSNKLTRSASKKAEIDKANKTASATTAVTVYDDFVFKRPLCPPSKPVVKPAVVKPAVDSASGKQAGSNLKKGGILKTKKKLKPIKFQYYAIQEVPKLKDIVVTKLREIARKQQPRLTTTIEKIIKPSNKKAGTAKKLTKKDNAKKRKPVDIEELKQYNDTVFCPIHLKKDLKFFNTYVKYINRRHAENVEEIKRLEKMRDEAGNDSVLIGVRHKVKKFDIDEAMTASETDDDEEDNNSRTKGRKKKRTALNRYCKPETEEEAAKKAAAAKAKAARARRNKGRSRTKSSINKRKQAREASQKRWAKQRADKARHLEEEERARREKDLDKAPLCIDKAQSMNKDLERDFDDQDLDKFIVAPGSQQVESLLDAARKRHRNKSKAYKLAIVDDGDSQCFRNRIAKYKKMRYYMDKESRRMDRKLEHVWLDGNSHDFYIPQKIWRLLFEYQREAVKWLFELHINLIGGILGDEMGLGKSVSLIAFLVALSKTKTSRNCELYSRLGPVILICPATVMFQWVEEFQKWAPKFRVCVLHASGSNRGKSKSRMIQETIRDRGVLITSYGTLASYQEYLLKHSWHYVVLDEGHRIRNPEAQITNICKRFETCHRLLLTGTPMQNNLKEFWSLIDFVCPGKLGLLASFEKNIAVPIRKACARDSTPLAKHVAYKCASLLHQIVGEFVLRRTKEQVQNKLQLPPKTEQICLCRLTDVQRECYANFLSACYPKFCKGEYIDRVSMFKFMIKARKICNHPYLYSPKYKTQTVYSKEFFEQSSKMVVLDKLLEHWHNNGHRVLVFSQGIKTLNLIEKFVQKKRYTYFRMDGATPIKDRQDMIKSYNKENETFLFLLTTRVGGVGVTLTGADRVIIFDPDWNPCTDMQAKERCWRIGQKRNVMIYRLLAAGTIEERIYQRQEFKCFLSDQILNDLNHEQFLKMTDCKELFSLNDCHETSIFHYDTKLKLNLKRKYEKISEDKKHLSESTKSLPKIPKLAIAESSKSSEKVAHGGKNEEKYEINWTKIPIQLSDEKKAELLAKAKKICQSFKHSKGEHKNKDDAHNAPQPLVKSESTTNSSDKPKSCLNYQIKGNPETGLSIQLLAHNEVQSSNVKIEDCQIDYLVKTYDAEPIKKPESSKKEKFESEFYLISKLPNVDIIQSGEKGEETGKKGDSVCKMLIEKFEEDKLNNNRIKLKPAEASAQLDSHFLARVNKKVKKFLTSYQTTSEKLATVAGKWEESTDLATALLIYFHKQLALPGKSTLSTEEIIKEFRTKIRPDQTQLLRTMIKSLARRVAYSGATEETAFWELKPEYKI